MKKNTIPLGSPQVQTSSQDLLETAEIIRAANAIVRMSVGILGLSGQMCRAEVFTSEEQKELGSHFTEVINAFGRVYQALMAAYSARLSAEESSESLERAKL